MMGKRKVFNCIYCSRPVTGRHHAIASKNEYTHDDKAGLSLCWCIWDFFFCLIDAFMFHLDEPRLEKTAQLISYIVQFLSFLYLIFHGSRRLLRPYITIFDGPRRKPLSRQVFSMRGDGFEYYKVQFCMFIFNFCTCK